MRITNDHPYSFLLESVEKGTQYARYSFLGVNPKKVLIHQDGETTILANGKIENTEWSFRDLLHSITENYKTPAITDIPGFTGGLVGFLGYETITWITKIC